MNVQRLVQMANDIANNVSVDPDRATAIETMVLHLLRFWAPPMRIGIVRHLREHGGAGLTPFARDAIETLARNIDATPPPNRPGVSDAG